MRRTVAYAAMTKDEAQRSIRTFYVAVKYDSDIMKKAQTRPGLCLLHYDYP